MATCDNDDQLSGCSDCGCATTTNPVCFEESSTYTGSVLVTVGAFEQLSSCEMKFNKCFGTGPGSCADCFTIRRDCGSNLSKRCEPSREQCNVYTGSYIVGQNTPGSPVWSSSILSGTGGFEVADKHYLNIHVTPGFVSLQYTRPVGFLGGGEEECRFGLRDHDNGACNENVFGFSLAPGFELKEYRFNKFDNVTPELGKTLCLHEQYRFGLFTQDAADDIFLPTWRACIIPHTQRCCPAAGVYRNPVGPLCEGPESVTVTYL